MILITQKVHKSHSSAAQITLSLSAQERSKSRLNCLADSGEKLLLQLPRGTVLQDGDILTTDNQQIFIKIIAKAEPLVKIKANSQLTLMRAVYHLANRHVSLEITINYIALERDPVLENLLKQMGLELEYLEVPFFPEQGAYHQH